MTRCTWSVVVCNFGPKRRKGPDVKTRLIDIRKILGPDSSDYKRRPMETALKVSDERCFSRPLAYSIDSYARVQKSVNTLGGSGESIMRCVKRMPIIPCAGSV